MSVSSHILCPYPIAKNCLVETSALASLPDQIVLLIMTWSYCYNSQMKQHHSVFQSTEKLSILVHAFAQSNHFLSPRLPMQKLSRLHISSAVPCLSALTPPPPPYTGLVTPLVCLPRRSPRHSSYAGPHGKRRPFCTDRRMGNAIAALNPSDEDTGGACRSNRTSS